LPTADAFAQPLNVDAADLVRVRLVHMPFLSHLPSLDANTVRGADVGVVMCYCRRRFIRRIGAYLFTRRSRTRACALRICSTYAHGSRTRAQPGSSNNLHRAMDALRIKPLFVDVARQAASALRLPLQNTAFAAPIAPANAGLALCCAHTALFQGVSYGTSFSSFTAWRDPIPVARDARLPLRI